MLVHIFTELSGSFLYWHPSSDGLQRSVEIILQHRTSHPSPLPLQPSLTHLIPSCRHCVEWLGKFNSLFASNFVEG